MQNKILLFRRDLEKIYLLNEKDGPLLKQITVVQKELVKLAKIIDR
jgi:hypothetical protein